jgi:hypothetical protein
VCSFSSGYKIASAGLTPFDLGHWAYEPGSLLHYCCFFSSCGFVYKAAWRRVVTAFEFFLKPRSHDVARFQMISGQVGRFTPPYNRSYGVSLASSAKIGRNIPLCLLYASFLVQRLQRKSIRDLVQACGSCVMILGLGIILGKI